MLPPPHMLPAKAPKPVTRSRCVITGKPALYRDPVSGHAYADLAAYKELKQRWESERRGKTRRRTKRQRTSSVPLACLDEEALQAMQEDGPQQAMQADGPQQAMQEDAPQQAMQHLAPDGAGVVATMQPPIGTDLRTVSAMNAAPAFSTQQGQRHTATTSQAGPKQNLPTAADMVLGTSQDVAESQQSPNIVTSQPLPGDKAVSQGLLAAAAPPASAVLLHQ